MKETATIILNRNLPQITDALYENLERNNAKDTDIYVVESGSSKENLSRYCSFWASWEESLDNGLRYPRGFNFALTKLWEEGKFDQYEYFFLICNDSIFENKPIIGKFAEIMKKHTRLGILSPCSKRWGERKLFKDEDIKYFWHINHISWFVRRELIDAVRELEEPTYMNFLYDGQNFRGYECDVELIAKGYANDWAAGITTEVEVEENEEILKTEYTRMKTDEYHINRQKLVEEGRRWLRRKYGFNSRWTMQMYAKFFYDKFFEYYPELEKFKI